MTITAEARLAELGLTMEIANAYVMANLDHLDGILHIARQYGITNSMLGEIAGWPGTAYPADVVKAFCTQQGYDSGVLDLPAGEVRIISVSEASATEGGTLVYTVTMSEMTTATMGMDAFFAGSLNNDEMGTPTATAGVTLSNGGISIPAGVSSFEIHLPVLEDSAIEGTETAYLHIGSFIKAGNVADNDSGQPSSGLVSVVGDPTVTEGSDLVYMVAFNATPSSQTTVAFSIELGATSASDIGTPTFTNGVTLAGDQLVIPAGTNGFTVVIPTVNDTAAEGFERIFVTVDGVTGTGYIADNDASMPDEVMLMGVAAADGAA